MYIKVSLTFYTDTFGINTKEEFIIKGEHASLVTKGVYTKMIAEQKRAIIKGNETIKFKEEVWKRKQKQP